MKIVSFVKSQDKYFLFSGSVASISLIIILSSYGVLYTGLPHKLPLLYSLPWGETQLVSREQFLILPGVLALISLVNLLFASQLHLLQQTLKRILTLSLVIFSVIILITALEIFFIII